MSEEDEDNFSPFLWGAVRKYGGADIDLFPELKLARETLVYPQAKKRKKIKIKKGLNVNFIMGPKRWSMQDDEYEKVSSRTLLFS